MLKMYFDSKFVGSGRRFFLDPLEILNWLCW